MEYLPRTFILKFFTILKFFISYFEPIASLENPNLLIFLLSSNFQVVFIQNIEKELYGMRGNYTKYLPQQ